MALTQRTFTLDPEDYERFCIYAAARKLNTSEAMRILMRKYLQALDDHFDQKRGAELVAAEKQAMLDQIVLRKVAK